MIFPFLNNDKFIEVTENKLPVPVEYEVNFDTGVLTGKLVEGKEAVKVWVLKMLKTSRYKYLIYTWDYGVELDDLISMTYDRAYIESEIARNIEEALMINPYIKDMINFKAKFEGTYLTIEFTVLTDFGEVNINERADI